MQTHEGYKLKRIREILGKKQETLANELGEGWTQKKISQLESKEVIEPSLLEFVAGKLGVTPEIIKNFEESATPQLISTSLDNSSNINYLNCSVSFNLVDKLVEVYEENKKLYERIIALEQSVRNGNSETGK